jgi:hypothetical protein
VRYMYRALELFFSCVSHQGDKTGPLKKLAVDILPYLS